MNKKQVLGAFVIGLFFLVNVSKSFASGTESPSAGSVREDERNSELEEKRDALREKRREKRLKKKQAAPVRSSQDETPTSDEVSPDEAQNSNE